MPNFNTRPASFTRSSLYRAGKLLQAICTTVLFVGGVPYKPVQPSDTFRWSETDQQSFEALIGALMSATVLRVWDPGLPTRRTTDASELTVSEILEQPDPSGALIRFPTSPANSQPRSTHTDPICWSTASSLFARATRTTPFNSTRIMQVCSKFCTNSR